MIVSATANIMWTCDAEVITQVMNRRNDFSKAVEMMGMLNVYGPIKASEGDEHRAYRKVASPSFNDENYQLVWAGAIEQADSMTQEWSLNEHGSIANLNANSSKLALHVISKVFFGKTMSWNGSDNAKPPLGHILTYNRAITAVFEYNSTTPWPLLSKFAILFILPFDLYLKPCRLFSHENP